MEIRKVIDLLRATIDPNQRQQAETQLDQVRKTCARGIGMPGIILLDFIKQQRRTHESWNYWSDLKYLD